MLCIMNVFACTKEVHGDRHIQKKQHVIMGKSIKAYIFAYITLILF